MSVEWISTEEAAEISGYHREYVREMIRLKKIDGRKFATVWQVDKQSLLAYLKTSQESKDDRWGPKK